MGVQLQATTLFEDLTFYETLKLFGSFYPRAISPDRLLAEVALEDKARGRRISSAGSGWRWPSRW